MYLNSIQKQEATIFLSKYHYLGKKAFRHSFIYGLVKDNAEFGESPLIGVCVFHMVSAPETCVGAFGLARTEQTGIWELGRLAMHPSLNGGNNTSWFVSRAIKKLCKDTRVRAIISYADSSAGHTGAIYRACNALYCGMTSIKNDYYIKGKIQERGKTKGVGGEWKPRPQKHRYVWIVDTALELKWPVVSCNARGLPKGIKISFLKS
jgi:hypothetical protein